MNLEESAKRSFTYVSVALLLYEAVFQIGSSRLIFRGIQADIAMAVTSLCGLFLVYLLIGRVFVPMQKTERFRAPKYFYFLLLIYGLQTLGSLLMMPLISFLHAHGFAMRYASDVASGGSVTGFWTILYSVLIAPLVEECLFRGLIYRYLSRYGRLWAIFISALMFGLIHLNLLQFVTAVLIGLLLACIRMRYGLACAILMHISNNVFALICNNCSGDYALIYLLYMALVYGGVLTLAIALVRRARVLQRFCRSECSFRPMLRLWFRTPMVWVVTILFAVMTLSSIYE